MPYRRSGYWSLLVIAGLLIGLTTDLTLAQPKAKRGKAKAADNSAKAGQKQDAKETLIGQAPEPRDPEFAKYGIYEQTAPRPQLAEPVATSLPLDLKPGDRVAL